MRTKILVFGEGLLGHAYKDVKGTAVLSKSQCDITKVEEIKTAINYYRPEIVINAAGIVPKNPASIEYTFKVNAFAPHYIADVCYNKCQFVHISTDCVFSGNRGMYTERDKADATGIYGMSKIFGEPTDALVIRTSFIGLPDPKGRGLLAWAQSQKEIIGYDNVFWNGVTTRELITKIDELTHETVRGIRHVYSYTISKYELLRCAAEVFRWEMPIYKESDHIKQRHSSNKTLGSIYATGFVAKPLKTQLRELL